MKLPNGYGSIWKLKGKRRKPWVVVSHEKVQQPDGIIKMKKHYLGYFEKRENAITFLSELNNSNIVAEHKSYSESLTFAEVYQKWIAWRKSMKKTCPSASSFRNYEIAFNMLSDLHCKKIINIKTQEIQNVVNKYSSKSRSTVGNIRALLRGMYKCSIINEWIESDPTQYVEFDYTNPDKPLHTRFTAKEIQTLWNELGSINNVDIILIYIYTGLRASELLKIKSEDVHLDEKYMIGGLKTEAGRNRIIPLHDAIVPLIENRLKDNREYLINNKWGNPYSYKSYNASNWKTCINKLKMNHNTHDCRYTFASLSDNVNMNETCKKIIMGHSISNKNRTAFKTGNKDNLTQGIYTEKTIEELVREVNKLPINFEKSL